jgi:hypothetical protein
MSAVDNEAPATAGAALVQRETGSVKWYHPLKQYGFIKPDRIGAGGPSADGIFMQILSPPTRTDRQ